MPTEIFVFYHPLVLATHGFPPKEASLGAIAFDPLCQKQCQRWVSWLSSWNKIAKIGRSLEGTRAVMRHSSSLTAFPRPGPLDAAASGQPTPDSIIVLEWVASCFSSHSADEVLGVTHRSNSGAQQLQHMEYVVNRKLANRQSPED
ncbi:hypothetical protein O181_026117 [Austropuccinia psidii MF-1]|uniref:Uncharacterized protein n=1 Tax=Austropuccinia psidii MF-1 TaxID=1389203 RepID=A0A9Q3H0I0_9BASI|nr:hypothetical protein [Austropuccinia psidii MF-1]